MCAWHRAAPKLKSVKTNQSCLIWELLHCLLDRYEGRLKVSQLVEVRYKRDMQKGG